MEPLTPPLESEAKSAAAAGASKRKRPMKAMKRNAMRGNKRKRSELGQIVNKHKKNINRKRNAMRRKKEKKDAQEAIEFLDKNLDSVVDAVKIALCLNR